MKSKYHIYTIAFQISVLPRPFMVAQFKVSWIQIFSRVFCVCGLSELCLVIIVYSWKVIYVS